MVKKAFIIMKKDLKEIIKDLNIMGPIYFLPILFAVLIPILMVFSFYGIVPSDSAQNLSEFPPELGLQYINLMILMMPPILPLSIAAYSFAGEKEKKTIESLILCPVSTNELLIGKYTEGQKRRVEIIRRKGVANSFALRDELNTMFFLELEKNMKKWPWVFKNNNTQKTIF